jgi:hypothetical protein
MSSYMVRLSVSPVIVPSRSRKRLVLSTNVKSGLRNFRCVRRAGSYLCINDSGESERDDAHR